MTTPTPADAAAAAQAATSTTATDGQQQPQGDGGGSSFDPNAPSISQSHMNHLLAEQKRKIREQYADYDDVKSKAEKFDSLVTTTQTAEEQASDLAAKLATRDRDVADLQLTVKRQELAAAAGIAPDLWSMIGGGDEDTIKANIEVLKKHTASPASDQQQGNGNGGQQQPRRRVAPGQGRPGAEGGAGPSGSLDAGRELYASRHKKQNA